MDGVIAYALSRAFTKKTVIGMGAIAGKNCQISSFTPITDGNRVTFAWYDNDNVLKTGHIDVMNGQKGADGTDGQDGQDGVSVANIQINTNYHLICTLSNGTTIDAGQINIEVDNELSDTSENPVQNKVITAALNNKVDKEIGKGLSTNDFTTNEKNKLANIEDNAEVNKIATITVNGQEVAIVDKNVALTIITNAVNNLQNYYLKSETYTQQEVQDLIGSAVGVSISIVEVLPETGQTNIIYFLPTETANVYSQYIYTANDGWVLIGSTTVDLSNYYTKEQVNALLNTKQNILTIDSFPTSLSNNPVASGGVYTAISQMQAKFQYTTLPTASADNLGMVFQYIGASGTYTQDMFYRCVYNSTLGQYEWQEVTFHADITIDSALSDTSTNPVQNRVVKSAIDKKQDIIQVDDLGEPSVTKVGKIYQYVGSSTSTTKNGYFYRCDSQGGAYVWTEIEFGTVGDFLEKVNELPTATASNVGHTYILVAPQTGYKLGGIYQCQSDGETPPTYSWTLISSSNLTAGDGIDIINDKINAKVDNVTTHIDPTTKVIYVDGKYKTIFIGSTSSWNSLTDEQKAQYELVSLNDESDYTGNIDAVPTQGSPNAVSSGGVYSAITDYQKKDLASAVEGASTVEGALGALSSGKVSTDLLPSDASASNKLVAHQTPYESFTLNNNSGTQKWYKLGTYTSGNNTARLDFVSARVDGQMFESSVRISGVGTNSNYVSWIGENGCEVSTIDIKVDTNRNLYVKMNSYSAVEIRVYGVFTLNIAEQSSEPSGTQIVIEKLVTESDTPKIVSYDINVTADGNGNANAGLITDRGIPINFKPASGKNYPCIPFIDWSGNIYIRPLNTTWGATDYGTESGINIQGTLYCIKV